MSANSTSVGKVKKELSAEQRKLRAEKRRLRKAKKAKPVVQIVAGRGGPMIKGSLPKYAGAEAKVGSLLSPSQRKELIAFLRQLMSGPVGDKLALIPRRVPMKVSACPFKHVQQLPYMNHEDGSTDPRQGVAGVELYRSISNPMRIWTVEAAGATTYAIRIYGQDARSGFWPSSDSTFDEGLINNTLELDTSDVLNAVGPVDHGALSSGISALMRRAVCAVDNTVFYGTPIDLTGASDDIVVTYKARSQDYFPDTFNISARLVSTTGATSWVNGSAAVSGATATTFTGTFTFTAGRTALGGAYACCLPDAPMGIQIKGVNATAYFQSLTLSFASQSTAKMGWMKPVPLSNLSSYNWVQTISFSSLRTWVEYVGSDLMNAGVISAVTSPGGRPPPLMGYCGYQSVASAQDSYIGPIKTGCWSWWKPQNEDDFVMLPRNDALSSITKTAYVVWAKVGAPQTGQSGQPEALNLVIEGTIEGSTRDTTRPLVECSANPLALTLAISLIYHMKAHMENPLHWKDITSFLGKVAKKVKGGAEFVAANKDWLIPAAVKIAGAAGVALL